MEEGEAGRDDRTTDAASECGVQELAACVEGEAEDTQPARASLLLTSSREWEGNGVSHNACKDVKLTVDAAVCILILIS